MSKYIRQPAASRARKIALDAAMIGLLPTAIKVLKLALDRGDTDAAKYICDRVGGKPAQSIAMQGEITIAVVRDKLPEAPAVGHPLEPMRAQARELVEQAPAQEPRP